MTNINTLTVQDKLALIQHEMLGVGAWVTGFCVANDLVDNGTAQTRKQVLANIVGIETDVFGDITTFGPEVIGDRNGFPWANARDFVDGVVASIKANETLLGVQNV